MSKARYTERQLKAAFDGYFRRIDPVMEVLRIGPLNENGIHTVVNSSKDFMSVQVVKQQQLGGGAIYANVDDKMNVFRELILSKNPKMPRDQDLTDHFAGTPLDVEKYPFFFVAYDTHTYDYVRKNTSQEREMPKARIMRTKKGVYFYLANESDVNGVFPMRIRLGKAGILVHQS